MEVGAGPLEDGIVGHRLQLGWIEHAVLVLGLPVVFQFHNNVHSVVSNSMIEVWG